jgi:hypothetical protein
LQLIRAKYRLKCILSIKGLPAWGIVLPILLATLFCIFLSNLYSKSGIELISVGIVSDEEIIKTDIFPKEQFKAYELTQTLADRYLEEGIIAAYVTMTDEDVELTALKSDEEQMVSLAYIDAYMNDIGHEEVANLLDKREAEKHAEMDMTDRHYQMLVLTCFCMLLPTMSILSEVRRNRRIAIVRHRMAMIPERQLVFCDTIIVVILVLMMSAIVYGYMYYLMQPIVL